LNVLMDEMEKLIKECAGRSPAVAAAAATVATVAAGG
jgi:hypothetical protein